MTEYFSHDYDAREDEKIQNLIYELKMEGYGVYWSIVEMLYKNEGYMQTHYERIAFALHTNIDIIKKVINDFELFELNGNAFHSPSVLHRLKLRKGKSIGAKKAAKTRWDKVKADDANAKQTQCKRNAIKESKVKERKVKESIYVDFLNLFNEITKRNFKGTAKDKGQFNARINEGFSIEDFKKAINNCKNDPYHIENPNYLTPEFITRADKLQKYLNYKPKKIESSFDD